MNSALATLSLPDRGQVLLALRDARFSQGLVCPRCQGLRIQRWGSFSGRQRYRCRTCRRTFSDLTGTPAAYLKRVELLPGYAGCLREAVSVREAAARLGIHPSTAFRWRHRFLRAVGRTRDPKLRGWIEIGSDWFPHSRKGERGITDRLPRRRGPRYRVRFRGRRAYVVMACDRLGHVVSRLIRGPSIEPDAIEETLAGRLDGAPVLTSPEGRLGPSARLARRRGWTFHQAHVGTLDLRRGLAHIRTALAYRLRFRRWLPRFRGVATKYLPNYLIWHQAVDAGHRNDLESVLLRWPPGAGFG